MKILLTTLLCLMLSVPVFADQQTTVLSNDLNTGKITGTVPFIDGSNDAGLEKQANTILEQKAKQLADKAGNNAKVSYKVTLNRPSLVSVLLKAEGNATLYDGVNIDLTTGKEFTLGDFFTENTDLKNSLGDYNGILFAENGLMVSRNANDGYASLIPYSKIITSMRIGSAGRILQIAKLTQNAEGKTLHIKSGNLLALKLASNTSTGYRWEVTESKGIKKVGSSFIMPIEDDRTGAGGTEIMVLAVQAPGEYNVNMEYKRPWEKQSFTKFTFKVVVEG